MQVKLCSLMVNDQEKVTFTRGPTVMGSVTLAVFADTCGNLIQVYQPKG